MRFSFKWGCWNCMVGVANYRGNDLVGCYTGAVNAENSSNGFCGIGFFSFFLVPLFFWGQEVEKNDCFGWFGGIVDG